MKRLEYFLLVGFLFFGLTACARHKIWLVDRNGIGLPTKTFSENNLRLGITLEGHCSVYQKKKIAVKRGKESKEIILAVVESLSANQPKELLPEMQLLLHVRISNSDREPYNAYLDSSIFQKPKQVISECLLIEKFMSISMPLTAGSWIKTSLIIVRNSQTKPLTLGPFIYGIREREMEYPKKGGGEKIVKQD